MKRRDFLRGTIGAVGAAWLVPAALRAQAGATGTFHPLRGGTGYFTGRGGTIGWLVNRDGLVAVDTQFPDTAQAFAEGLPGRDGRRFDVVINSHHHGDHTSGNPVLRTLTPTVLAHEHVPELMRAAAQRGGREVDPATLPTETTAGGRTIAVGSERIRLDYHGRAHTKGDLVITFEQANVVHTGDLMFNRLYPVIDRPGGASIRNWIAVLEKLERTYDEDTRFIFGHGSERFGVTGRRGDLLVFRDYLSGLLDHVQAQVDAGRSKEEIVSLENLPGFPDFHQPRPNRLEGNLAVAYDELTEGS